MLILKSLHLEHFMCITEADLNFDANCIIIEGDNYHALSVLNYTHTGKIDVIYIDPPYNTGNKDFTYKKGNIFLETIEVNLYKFL